MKISIRDKKIYKKVFSSVLLVIIALGLIMFELFTPALFLPDKEEVQLDFQGHLADHDDGPLAICNNDEENMNRSYRLEIIETQWEVGIEQSFTAWTFNKTIPGPSICGYEGDSLKIQVINKLHIAISFEVILAENQEIPFFEDTLDNFIEPNQSKIFIYYIPLNFSGTWIYRGAEGVDRGLYGAFIVYAQNENHLDHDIVIFQNEFAPPITDNNDFFAVQNGKIFPLSPHYVFILGETVRFRVINIGPGEDHTIHLHGHTWQDSDKKNVDNELLVPGEAVDRIVKMRMSGMWMYHCHIYDHIAAGMTGFLTVVPSDYDGEPLEYVQELFDSHEEDHLHFP